MGFGGAFADLEDLCDAWESEVIEIGECYDLRLAWRKAPNRSPQLCRLLRDLEVRDWAGAKSSERPNLCHEAPTM
jgi:hypothetical protein